MEDCVHRYDRYINLNYVYIWKTAYMYGRYINLNYVHI